MGLVVELGATVEVLLGVPPIAFEDVVMFDCRLSGNTIGYPKGFLNFERQQSTSILALQQ